MNPVTALALTMSLRCVGDITCAVSGFDPVKIRNILQSNLNVSLIDLRSINEVMFSASIPLEINVQKE